MLVSHYPVTFWSGEAPQATSIIPLYKPHGAGKEAGLRKLQSSITIRWFQVTIQKSQEINDW